MRVFHVTTPVGSEEILKEGFRPGWGDAGLGVYFYDNLEDAIAYGRRGGWDKSLKEYKVIQAEVPAAELARIEVNPEWPNPEDYESVIWAPADEDKDIDDDDQIRRWPRKLVAEGRARPLRRSPARR